MRARKGLSPLIKITMLTFLEKKSMKKPPGADCLSTRENNFLLQLSQVKCTSQDSINEFIIRKLNPLVVVDFTFLSAFLYVWWASNSHATLTRGSYEISTSSVSLKLMYGKCLPRNLIHSKIYNLTKYREVPLQYFTAHYASRNADLNLKLVGGTTDGFIFQIITSLIESWGVRLTCFDCNIVPIVVLVLESKLLCQRVCEQAKL